MDIVERLRSHEISPHHGGCADCYGTVMDDAADEIERLTLENWQLKGALGYPVPSDIPDGDFKCGLCDARRNAQVT